MLNLFKASVSTVGTVPYHVAALGICLCHSSGKHYYCSDLTEYSTKFVLLYGKANSSVLIGSFLIGILPYRPFPWQRPLAVYFLFGNAGKFKTSVAQVPYNKLLTNLANSSGTGDYWSSVIFCTDLAALSPCCHDLKPIFPSTALVLG